MNKKYYILTLFLIITLISIFGLKSKVYSAQATISASQIEIEQGTSITINTNISDASAWALDITSTGGNLIKSEERAGTTNSGQNESLTVRLGTFSADKAGTYKITLSGYVVDGSKEDFERINASGSLIITVKEKPQQEPQPEEPKPEEPQPEEPQPEDPKPEEPQPENPKPEEPQQPTVTFTDTNKTMYVDATSLNLREQYNTSSKILKSLKKDDTITVIATGSNGWYKIKTSDGTQGYVDSKYLTNTKPEQDNESSISTLSKITVNPGNLNETFSKDKQSYTMTVDSNTDSVEITATPTDENAKVTVTGNKGLTTGTGNVITIRVLAQNGSTRTYKIQVTKLASEDENPNIIDEEPTEEKKLGLTSLNIEKIKLSPTFKTDVYEYTATLTDQTIEKLNVNAVSSFEDAKIEVIGANEIKDGENVITITVTSVDGENTVTYQVIVNKTLPTAVAKTEPKQEGDNTKLFLGVGIVVAIAILAVIIIIISKKSKAKPMKIFEDGDFNEIGEEYNTTRDGEYRENSEELEEDEYYDEDDDDDWGTPKKGFLNKIKRSGRHF